MAVAAAAAVFVAVFVAVSYVGLRLVAGWERIRGDGR